jgi:uncharacterized protein YgbK (DUF1537 family)
MRDHPLTPMTDANLVRVMQAQTRRRVGLIDHKAVAQGEAAIRARIDALRAQGVGVAVVDAVSNDDLLRLGRALKPACRWSPPARAWRSACRPTFGLAPSPQASAAAARPPGCRPWCPGSCSIATNKQVAHFIAAGRPAFAVESAAAGGRR